MWYTDLILSTLGPYLGDLLGDKFNPIELPPRARELYDNYDYDSDMMYEDSTAAADYNDYDYDTQRDDRDSGYGSGSGGGYNDGIAVLSEFPIPLFVRFRHVLFW